MGVCPPATVARVCDVLRLVVVMLEAEQVKEAGALLDRLERLQKSKQGASFYAAEPDMAELLGEDAESRINAAIHAEVDAAIAVVLSQLSALGVDTRTITSGVRQ